MGPSTGHSTGAKSAVCASSPCATALEVWSVAVYATTVSMEKYRSASVTDMVPIAEERRAEKGTLSGERPHWLLMLIRPTTVESASTSGATC